jgi:hypothetical protein
VLTFNFFLNEVGLNPAKVKLARHKDRRAKRGRTPYDLWKAKDPDFEEYQRIQSKDRFKHATHLASFVVTPQQETMFIGLYSVDGLLPMPPGKHDPITGQDVSRFVGKDGNASSLFYYSLTRTTLLAEYTERMFIDWNNPIQWAQWAKQDKRVVEIRRQREEPAFPGFIQFPPTTFEALDALPDPWKTALRAAKGIYVLVCTKTGVYTKAGKLYVGSASGSDGFWGRWQEYFQTGHGGNEGLKLDPNAEYQVSIVEVAGSSADVPEIIALENRWKDKLRSRDFGNLNWPELRDKKLGQELGAAPQPLPD